MQKCRVNRVSIADRQTQASLTRQACEGEVIGVQCSLGKRKRGRPYLHAADSSRPLSASCHRSWEMVATQQPDLDMKQANHRPSMQGTDSRCPSGRSLGPLLSGTREPCRVVIGAEKKTDPRPGSSPGTRGILPRGHGIQSCGNFRCSLSLFARLLISHIKR